MKYYFTVYTRNFKHPEIDIEETELEKAQYAMMLGGSNNVTFKNGWVIASEITQIMPNYQRTMGWNPEHKLAQDDWTEINSTPGLRELPHAIGKAKNRLDYLIANKKEHLIGSNAHIPELEEKNTSAFSKELSKTLKM